MGACIIRSIIRPHWLGQLRDRLGVVPRVLHNHNYQPYTVQYSIDVRWPKYFHSYRLLLDLDLYSLTQPLRATVKVGGKVPVYSSLCSLSLGLPRNALILAKPRFGDKNIFLGLKFFKKINKFNFLLMKKF